MSEKTTPIEYVPTIPFSINYRKGGVKTGKLFACPYNVVQEGDGAYLQFQWPWTATNWKKFPDDISPLVLSAMRRKKTGIPARLIPGCNSRKKVVKGSQIIDDYVDGLVGAPGIWAEVIGLALSLEADNPVAIQITVENDICDGTYLVLSIDEVDISTCRLSRAELGQIFSL